MALRTHNYNTLDSNDRYFEVGLRRLSETERETYNATHEFVVHPNSLTETTAGDPQTIVTNLNLGQDGSTVAANVQLVGGRIEGGGLQDLSDSDFGDITIAVADDAGTPIVFLSATQVGTDLTTSIITPTLLTDTSYAAGDATAELEVTIDPVDVKSLSDIDAGLVRLFFRIQTTNI